jgi:hypothetical protein
LATPAGLQPLPRWAWGPLSVSCRPGTPTYKLQVKTRRGCAPTCRHVPYNTRPCLPAEVGSGAATCPVAPNPASLQGSALVCKCPTASDPTSLQGRALEHRVSYDSGATTACPMVFYGLRASSIKKSLACPPMQLGMHVPIARTPVSKAPDVSAIMGLQIMWACCIVNACRMCG